MSAADRMSSTGTFHRAPRRLVPAVLAALVLPALPAPWVPMASAEQAEFCVTCQGPDAVYRCTFDIATAMPARPGLQLHCISTLAREGGHQSCSIGRASKAQCPGTLKVLALPDAPPVTVPGAAQQAESPQPAGDADAGAENAAAPASAQTTAVEPPQTDVEMQGVRPSTPPPAIAPPPAVKRTWSDGSGPAGEPAPSGAAPAEPAQVAADKPEGPGDGTAEPPPSSGGLLEPLEGAGKAVGDAAKTTGDALGKAGDAVSSAAKKSWKCLTSLFGDC